MDPTPEYGIQDIYEGVFKATNDMIILGQKYRAGDIVLWFNSIQQISWQEVLNANSATGGFDNRALVHWESTKEITGNLQVGVISPLAFGIAQNTRLNQTLRSKLISQVEVHTSNDKGFFTLRHVPVGAVKIQQIINGTPIRKNLDYAINDNTLQIEIPETDILVEYSFNYSGLQQIIEVGHKDINGYLGFVGKFYYTNEYTAVVKTGLIEIPKLKINSNFQLILGRSANPFISNLSFSALPVGDREHAKTIEIDYLDDDIDGDI